MLAVNQHTLACCAFPTTIMIIDDQPAILDSLRFSLHMPIQVMTNPQQALTTLSSYQPVITDALWLNLDEQSDIWDGMHKQPALMNIRNILSIKNMSRRFDDISVIIVDYQMPEMDGLTLLKKLADKPFKKILLTGKGDNALAVKAFNEGLIDYFLHKDDPELPQKIRNIVKQLKQQYFIDLSKKTLDLLSKGNAIFSNPTAAAFFYEKINAMNVNEFYLLDINGSYLLKSKSDERNYILMHTAEYIDTIAEHGASDHATTMVINKIKEKQAFPYFGEHLAYWQVKGEDWEKYMHPLEEIKIGKQVFYAAVFSCSAI